MNAATAIAALRRSGLDVFTTREAAAIWGGSGPAATQMLRRLAHAGLVGRARRGLWTFGSVDAMRVAMRIAEPDPTYISLLTALRFHGVVTQITPEVQAITTSRARVVKTPLGRVDLHHVEPEFFGGFERTRGIAIATPEKALVDALYIGSSRAARFARLPELEIGPTFSRSEARRWAARIPSNRLRTAVRKRLDELLGPVKASPGRRSR